MKREDAWLIVAFIIIVVLTFELESIIGKFLGTEIPLAVVSSYSMDPTLHVGDLIVIKGESTYNKGDIIVFSQEGKLIVHRIYSKTSSVFYTKGDSNPCPDPWKLNLSDIKGRVILVIPFAGLFTLVYAKSPILMIMIILFLLALIVIKYFEEKRR